MNELVFRNAISIPNGQISIPFERMFGSKKSGFGTSSARMSQLSPPEILNLLKEKFSNVTLAQSASVSSHGSLSTTTSQSQQSHQIPKKSEQSHMRFHIPSHKNHVAQLVKDRELAQEKQRERAQSHSDIGQQSSVQKSKQAKPILSLIRKGHAQQIHQPKVNGENIITERSSFQAINEQNKIFLKDMYSMTEDLVTPIQKKNRNSQRYKQTHRSCFMGAAREKQEDVLIRNKFLPGPGDYEVPRMFESNDAKKKTRKARAISSYLLQEEKNGGIDETDEFIYENVEPWIEEENNMKIEMEKRREQSKQEIKKRQILRVKEKLQKTLAETAVGGISEDGKGDSSVSTVVAAAAAAPHVNQSYMFTKDDRDRFGDQIFPLAGVCDIPGPGKYDQDYYSLQRRVQIIQSQEEQKKLLKIWLHPMKEDAKNATKNVQNTRQLQFDPDGPIHLKHY